ncbi:wall-associated protein [Listeria fleischmannii FSL S10-1203]|uniref:Wall-associated protein n=1 Tax=Listeria fleischmannii FSL S10-1203 TaxID=1265822 RepID=W7DNM8_9LIST|nr:RHS repeat-associated core domain-containing protein [Listeria fleischmannii]EUJ57923.1 wall-associated protein [Listeria fleischmannii FSL S10-1203]
MYYHYNAHGDVVALTDENGKVVAEYAYDAWGVVLKNTATTTEARANPYLYAGYTYDKEIEQYYLMARYYEPEQGVFTAYDPDPGDEDDPQTMNGYNYANNNPVTMIDPDGNIAVAWWVVAGGIGAFEGGAQYLLTTKKKTWKGFGKSVLSGAAWGIGFGKFYRVAKYVKSTKVVKKGIDKFKGTKVFKKI